MTGSSIVCFLVNDEPPRDRWRIAATMQAVMGFAKAESKRLGTKVYPAHTRYGDDAEVTKLEGYLQNYALGDGWYGPLSHDTMSALAARIRKETPAFLATEVLP